MRSNYQKLSKYIKLVTCRNFDLRDLPLIGLSISKKFIPSIANTIGTDMTSYRVIERNQFAYSPVTSRNSDKLTIALFNDFEKALISQAYTVFEVCDVNELDPEYLMMWFSRTEFDRYARFKSHGSAREIFDWEEMCNILLPVPSIRKQREIVKEYNIIQDRIELKNKFIHRLEETSQAIYKRWFVDFEFPDAEGKPYKSYGGEMIYIHEYKKEIPKEWRVGTLQDLYKFQYGLGNNNPDNGGIYPVFGSNGRIGGYHKFNNEDSPVIGHIGANCGSVVFAYGKHYVTYNGIMCFAKNKDIRWFSYQTLLNQDIMSQTRGSSQPFISYDMIYEIPIIMPPEQIAEKYDMLMGSINHQLCHCISENQKLIEINDIFLSKLAIEKK